MRLASIQKEKLALSTRKKLPGLRDPGSCRMVDAGGHGRRDEGGQVLDRADKKKEFEDAERRYGHALVVRETNW